MHAYFLMMVVAFTVAGCAAAATVQRPTDLTQLSVTDAALLIRDKKVTSTELTQAYLAKADANKDLNAYVTVDRAGAIATARRADADLTAGKQVGPLHGVPLVVKDNTHVAGLPNTAGTPALRPSSPRRTRRRSRSWSMPARSSWARRICTSWPSESPATTRLLYRAADRHAQSVRPHAHRRWQLERYRRCDWCPAGAGRTRQRYGWLRPDPIRADRWRRAAADHRAL
jgi:hypothetical protein